MIGNTQQEFQKYFVKQAISDTAISCALGFHSLKCKRQNEPKVTEIKQWLPEKGRLWKGQEDFLEQREEMEMEGCLPAVGSVCKLCA